MRSIGRFATLHILFLVASSLALSQQIAPSLPTSDASAITPAQTHENVVNLIQLMGVCERIESIKDKMAEDGKEKMQHDFPSFAPAFCEEWAKRMRARTNVDDYIDVYVRAYESRFSNDEIVEMIDAQRQLNASKPPNISPHLRDKLNSVFIGLQSEIIGGCSQVGAKLGGEIALELGKEHPEWAKNAQPAAK